MNFNPFTSQTYREVWLKHFGESKTILSFEFIKKVKFVKHSILPLYVNVGKNLTKGIDYSIDDHFDDYKGKTFLIYDVPSYFDLAPFNLKNENSLRLKEVFQYEGYLMDLSNVADENEYIKEQFSSKNRREFRSNKRRLESCFDITYEFINQALPKEEFDAIFNAFHQLLGKRYHQKQTSYHHLSEVKWKFYEELVFKMLAENKASLLIIYDKETPIGITLNFHADTILFETITVFDPDYYKFSIGKTSIIKLMEWCFANGYHISDFSKGYFDYKEKWSNKKYDFNYHILYDSKSIKAVATAKFVALFYGIKLFLRKRNVNKLYRRILFVFKRKDRSEQNGRTHYTIEKLDSFHSGDSYEEVDFLEPQFAFLRKPIYTILYAVQEHISTIKVFQDSGNKKVFVVKSNKGAQKITFS